MSHRAKYNKRKIKNVKSRRDLKRKHRRKKLSNRPINNEQSNQQNGFDEISFDPLQIYKAPPHPGSLEFISGATFRNIISRICIYLISITNDDREYLYPKVTIINVKSNENDAFWNYLIKSFEHLASLKVDDKYDRYLRSRIELIENNYLTIDSLMEEIDNLPKNTAFIVLESDQFIDKYDTDQTEFMGRSLLRSEEDYLIPKLSSLCKVILNRCKINSLYGVVHTTKSSPTKEENIDTLNSIEDMYPIFFNSPQDTNSIASKNSQSWLDILITKGEGILIEQLKSDNIHVSDQALILAQLWNKLEDTSNTRKHLEEINEDIERYDPTTRVKIAHMSNKCQSPEKTLTILPDAHDIFNKEALTLGLEITTQLKDNEKIESYYNKLSKLDPHNLQLRKNIEQRVLSTLENIETSNVTNIGFTCTDTTLVNTLSNPDYDCRPILDRIETTDEFELICTATRAMAQRIPEVSSIIASQLVSSALFGTQAVYILYRSTKDIFLHGNFSNEQLSKNLKSIESLIRYISRNPDNIQARESISHLVAVEVSGSFGFPLAVATAFNAINNYNSHNFIEFPRNESLNKVDESHLDAIKDIISWIHQRGVIEIGTVVVPTEILAVEADALIDTIYKLVDLNSSTVASLEDMQFVDLLVSICSSIYPHAEVKYNQDLRLIKYLASIYANKGLYEKARGLSEQLLRICGTDSQRLRIAWLCYADVQNRGRNNTEALIGLSCFYAIDTDTYIKEGWDELHVTIRTFRDIGFLEHASRLLPYLEQLSTKQGIDPSEDKRIIALQDSIDLKKLERSDDSSLFTFIDKICKRCNEAKNKKEATPNVILLVQCLKRLKDQGIEPSKSHIDTLKVSLELCDQEIKDIANLLYEDLPDAELLSKHYNSLRKAENWLQSNNDFALLEVASRNIVSIDSHFDIKYLATEILADQVLTDHRSDTIINLRYIKRSIDSLVSSGHSILHLALDMNDNLFASLTTDKGVKVLRDTSTSENTYKSRFNKWSLKYPYSYGHIDSQDGNNTFFITIDDLSFSIPNVDSLIVVAEPYLQRLPIALVPTINSSQISHFLGNQAKISNIPSISWLTKNREIDKNITSKRNAWIPLNNEEASTLNTLHDRLSGILSDHDITLSTSQKVPDRLCDSKLSILAAHGGVMSDQGFIHRISDEEHNLVSPIEIANSVRNCEIVVLFICSAGRVDKDPLTNKSYGLPMEMLKRGVSTVIAPPWPLDIKAASNWLEIFLNKLESGATVSEANFEANNSLIKTLGDFAGYTLAMTLYGNPDVCL